MCDPLRHHVVQATLVRGEGLRHMATLTPRSADTNPAPIPSPPAAMGSARLPASAVLWKCPPASDAHLLRETPDKPAGPRPAIDPAAATPLATRGIIH